MLSMDVEICVDSRDPEYVARSVKTAFSAGAKRIELCSDMHLDGLTPPGEHIQAARRAMGENSGLLCMIRPRSGNFFYSEQEVDLMEKQIDLAADSGADGVVFGALKASDHSIDEKALGRLMYKAKSRYLDVTFHRAFDACQNMNASLDLLIEHGVDRVLTSGTAWESGDSAVQGLPVLEKLVRQAGKRLEMVVGGGVTPSNAHTIVQSLSLAPLNGSVSLHLHSGVMEAGEVSRELVKKMCSEAIQ